MAGRNIDYSTIFNKTLPSPSGKWQGHPKYNFVGGHSDPDLVPMDGFIESAANVFKGDPKNIAMYNFEGGPQGILSLRNFLVGKLSAERGIHVTAEEVLITSGSGQAIELINEILLDEGDTVIVESFTFSGALSYLKRRGVNFVGVDLDENGIRMDHLEDILADLKTKGIRPKYIYTIPTLQNPTGTVMTMDRRHRLLSLSEEYEVPVFEDECYADLIFEGEYEKAIRALDDSNRVLHIGSFSKSLGPGLRLGYIVASWDVMSRLLSRKTDAGTGVMDQMIVGDYFSNHYDAHIQDMRGALKRKCNVLSAALREHFGPLVDFEEPRGGMYLWVKLPPGIDSRDLAQTALEEGIAYNPGPDWSADPDSAANYIRLCFALPSETEIWEGIEKLAKVFQL
ncbi:MAG: PLP-dependent aminotransferase family protein [Chloroflexota bacterium]|nr:PLP-dependent aminotransferase family protein [Dehalococcoidia bacterium]MEC8911327.1 PLP-dependent aminotransferase family protein [Chloroflexota bacterium]MEC8959190.1 PLP-dependent aminotransferase family protein [Chloroflexota bacterium]MEC9013171.1 PLP-dependent aminotransferase family protein [Chloroflexota bacterium]|tara:strand:+ start:615 stop:1805 length:1191 start_codon:yes stop_codon:yes gene_type:complete